MKLEVENRTSELEDAIEMGAALNMDTADESVKYVTDDKVSKLKEHWETVFEKIGTNIKRLEQLNSK